MLALGLPLFATRTPPGLLAVAQRPFSQAAICLHYTESLPSCQPENEAVVRSVIREDRIEYPGE